MVENVSNVFEEIDGTNEAEVFDTSDKEFLPDQMKGSGKFIKNPAVGETITLVMKKLVKSSKTEITTQDGTRFNVGLKMKNGDVVRYDIITKDDERYTINSWEVYFKLFGKDSQLLQLCAQNKNTFTGLVVKITRNFNGKYATERPENVAKLEGMSVEDARTLVDKIKKAKAESGLYTVVAAKQ